MPVRRVHVPQRRGDHLDVGKTFQHPIEPIIPSHSHIVNITVDMTRHLVGTGEQNCSFSVLGVLLRGTVVRTSSGEARQRDHATRGLPTGLAARPQQLFCGQEQPQYSRSLRTRQHQSAARIEQLPAHRRQGFSLSPASQRFPVR